MGFVENYGNIPILTREEEQDLSYKVKNGDKDAREKMIYHNLRLVASVAVDYSSRGLDFEDLVQEGTIGLIKAIEKFDPGRGYKFSTYAIHWIRQKMHRAINAQVRTIRLPDHVANSNNRLLKIKRRISSELGREATNEELAYAAGITLGDVEHFERITKEIISIDQIIDIESINARTLLDIVESTATLDPAIIYENTELRDIIQDILSHLEHFSPKDKEILEKLYGIKTGTPRTLRDVGRDYGVTNERIRQIKVNCFNKFRHVKKYKKRIKDFI